MIMAVGLYVHDAGPSSETILLGSGTYEADPGPVEDRTADLPFAGKLHRRVDQHGQHRRRRLHQLHSHCRALAS